MGRMIRSCERLTVGSCQTLMMNLFTNNHLREKFHRRKIRSIKFFKGYLAQTFLSLFLNTLAHFMNVQIWKLFLVHILGLSVVRDLSKQF